MGWAGHAKAAGYRWDAINQAVLDTYLEVMARRGAVASASCLSKCDRFPRAGSVTAAKAGVITSAYAAPAGELPAFAG